MRARAAAGGCARALNSIWSKAPPGWMMTVDGWLVNRIGLPPGHLDLSVRAVAHQTSTPPDDLIHTDTDTGGRACPFSFESMSLRSAYTCTWYGVQVPTCPNSDAHLRQDRAQGQYSTTSQLPGPPTFYLLHSPSNICTSTASTPVLLLLFLPHMHPHPHRCPYYLSLCTGKISFFLN